jgi:hypothetical protein
MPSSFQQEIERIAIRNPPLPNESNNKVYRKLLSWRDNEKIILTCVEATAGDDAQMIHVRRYSSDSIH